VLGSGAVVALGTTASGSVTGGVAVGTPGASFGATVGVVSVPLGVVVPGTVTPGIAPTGSPPSVGIPGGVVPP
jgi:hypothetical protein